jgi:hypothetical protein
LALADLSTVAKRTTLTGTSSWLDTLVLVPGLHYQQSAESLEKSTPQSAQTLEAHSNTGGQSRTSLVSNPATAGYLRRVGSSSTGRAKPIILDIGSQKDVSSKTDSPETSKPFSIVGIGRFTNPFKAFSALSIRSTLLYFLSIALTIVAIVLMILTRDWWGLGMLLALMLSRVLNIYIIRARISVRPSPPSTPNILESWSIPLPGNQSIMLRGLGHDLQALTTGEWMRAKTDIEGYLEAAAKLIVYLVAAFSGNQKQTGDMILMVLLLCSAGLLALSNARQGTFEMNGRVANEVPERKSLLRKRTESAPGDFTGKKKGADVEKGGNISALGGVVAANTM